MTEEIWKPISGYEEKYMVSNLGRVKSLNYNRTGKEKILKPGKNTKSYLYVFLYSNNKHKKYYIHRLVGETFLVNPNNLYQINHKDENPMNNCTNNLEWCDNRYNIRYSQAKKVGCFKDNQLVKSYNSIIDTEIDGFNQGHVCECCRENRKSHHGFQFKYLED